MPPDNVDSTMGYWVYGDKVLLISSLSEGFGVILQSGEFASLMQTQHQMIWPIATPLDKLNL